MKLGSKTFGILLPSLCLSARQERTTMIRLCSQYSLASSYHSMSYPYLILPPSSQLKLPALVCLMFCVCSLLESGSEGEE